MYESRYFKFPDKHYNEQLLTFHIKEETDLGDDADLLSLPINEQLQQKSEQKKPDSAVEVEQLRVQIAKLNQTADIFVPRNIKLLQEYDAAIGRDGKTFIPLEHTGMIGYGAEEDAKSDVDFMKLTNWHAMIIGPQEVWEKF
jgi:hypothetical protein